MKAMNLRRIVSQRTMREEGWRSPDFGVISQSSQGFAVNQLDTGVEVDMVLLIYLKGFSLLPLNIYVFQRPMSVRS